LTTVAGLLTVGEQLDEATDCIVSGFFVKRVDLHRDRDARVPEDPLSVARLYLQPAGDRGRGPFPDRLNPPGPEMFVPGDRSLRQAGTGQARWTPW
jgi:hypothetical protein